MEFKSLNGVGFKGLNSDIASWELPPEFITSGTNFRTDANRIESAGSSEIWIDPAGSDLSGHIIPVLSESADFWLIMGRAIAKVWDGSSYNVITSAAGYGGLSVDDELKWTSCMLGKIPIVNNPQHIPEYWEPQDTSQILQPLLWDASNTWDAKGYAFDVIRSHKNILFALSLYEGVDEIPSGYAWSHPADINGLPFSWDPTDASSLAGREQLGGDSGRILDGWSLRDSFCIYSERGVNILDWTGDEFVWRRRELSSAFGLVTRNCVAEIKGTHFFLGDGDIVKNDGNRLDSAVHNKIRKRLTAQMSADYYDRSFVVRNPARKEIWFCVPEDSAEYPNTAYVYNWRDDDWSIHDLPDNISHAAYGPKSDAPLTYADMTDPLTQAYNTTLLTYGKQQATPLSNTVVGLVQTDGGLTVLDPTISTAEDTDFFIERTDILLGEHDDVNTITRVYPYMDGTDPVSIQIGASQYADGPIKWTSEFTFDPSTDRKLDLRITGSLHAYRIKSIGSGSVKMTGLGVEFSRSGKR